MDAAVLSRRRLLGRSLASTAVAAQDNSANPEILTLVIHVGYVVAVLALYLRPAAPRTPPTATAAPVVRT